jgi:hypothetical protein
MTTMMHEDELFGELRSILQRPASTSTWSALCEHLDRWPLDTLEKVAVPYAASHLERWPQEIARGASGRWLGELMRGSPLPQLGATRALSIVAPSSYQEQLRYTLDNKAMRHLTDLTIVAHALSVKGVKSWSNAPLLATLERLTLVTTGLGKPLVPSKLLAHLTGLELNLAARPTPDQLRELAIVPGDRMRALRVISAALEPQQLGALLDAPLFARLDQLDLTLDRVPQDLCTVLSRAPQLAALRTLSLAIHDPITDLDALLSRPALAGLERLTIRASRLAPEALRPLIDATHLTRLTALTLIAQQLDATALLSAPHMAGLTALDLSWPGATPSDVAPALAGAEHLTRLATLDLSGRLIDAAGAAAMADAAHLSSLRDLRVRLKDAASCAALVGGEALSGLTALSLAGSPVGDEGAQALAASPHLSNLRALDLSSCGLTAAGIAALARSRHLSGLHHLDLRGNTTGRPAIEALARAHHLSGCELGLSDRIDLHEVLRLRALYLKYPEI